MADPEAAPGAVVARVRSLRKSFGRGRTSRTILAGVDLDVAAGELLAVVGRSGTGKSTLLHLLGGLEPADGGSIEVGGVRVDGARERELRVLRRERVGFIFQFFHLLPELSGEENVLLAARMNGAGRAAVQRTDALIEELGLAPVRGALPHELSGGEQQRFAIARALVRQPPLVLADEPTGNLDPVSGAVVLGLLREIAAGDRAVVLVTHERAATDLADRVLRLEDGLLVP